MCSSQSATSHQRLSTSLREPAGGCLPAPLPAKQLALAPLALSPDGEGALQMEEAVDASSGTTATMCTVSNEALGLLLC